mmetsp:Transcript_4878/g.14713  ORF Transcript_4878/g.14713 Transcript_4878/m.14713 type:complete len:290 (+) Transcript_4878:70-939(+)
MYILAASPRGTDAASALPGHVLKNAVRLVDLLIVVIFGHLFVRHSIGLSEVVTSLHIPHLPIELFCLGVGHIVESSGRPFFLTRIKEQRLLPKLEPHLVLVVLLSLKLEVCRVEHWSRLKALLQEVEVHREVGVLQGLLSRYSLVRVEGEHTRDQVNFLLGSIGDQLAQRKRLSPRYVGHYITRLWASQLFYDGCRWLSRNLSDQVNLLYRISPRKKRPAPSEDLSKDAPHAPHVDRRRILRQVDKDELRRPIPPSGDIICPNNELFSVFWSSPGQPEITNPDMTFLVQ